MSRDSSLDVLLDLDGQVLVVDPDGGHWVRFVVTRVVASPAKPHGLDYSLTLHGPDGERLVGFDNAHPVARQKRGEPQDHRHRLRTIRAYEYRDAATLLEDFWKGYTSKTKIVFINQISSATALIFPVKEIIQKAKSLGLITIIDGAHVPGHVDLNLTDLDPDYYTGTLHKWMLAPKGCSFLYVKKELQNNIDPLVVGWGYQSESPSKSRFLDYHEFQGTRDISAFLTAPAAIQFLKENHWTEKAKQSKQLILENYQKFCDLLGSTPICPVTNEFLGQMCSIPIKTERPMVLKELLFEKYKIEIPVMKIDHGIFLRISLNAYNDEKDLETLYNAIKEIKTTTDLLL